MFISRSGSSCIIHTCTHKQTCTHELILALHSHHHTDVSAFISCDRTGRSKDTEGVCARVSVCLCVCVCMSACVFYKVDSFHSDGRGSHRAGGDPLAVTDNW